MWSRTRPLARSGEASPPTSNTYHTVYLRCCKPLSCITNPCHPTRPRKGRRGWDDARERGGAASRALNPYDRERCLRQRCMYRGLRAFFTTCMSERSFLPLPGHSCVAADHLRAAPLQCHNVTAGQFFVTESGHVTVARAGRFRPISRTLRATTVRHPRKPAATLLPWVGLSGRFWSVIASETGPRHACVWRLSAGMV